MTNPKTVLPNFKDSLSRIKTLTWVFCLTALVPISGHADDIEIYTGLTGEVSDVSVTSAQKPNILFVLDTSGSMSVPEVVLNARPGYDPIVDYGDAGIGDDVYVYNIDRVYTGMSVTSADNNCQSAADFHTTNPSFPEYVDRALVWQYIPGRTEDVQNCTNTGASDVQSYTDTSTSKNRWNTITQSHEVTPGEELDISFSVQTKGYVVYYFWDANQDKINATNYCYAYVGNGRSIDCGTVTVPNDAVHLRARYYRTGNSGRRGDNATVNITRSQTCTTETIVTPASGGWVMEPIDNTAQIVALECELDSGIHGSSEGSTDIYAQHQEDTNDAQTPNYVSAAGNIQAVDWNSPDYEERLLVPDNYHQYLQSSVADLLGSGTTSVQISGSNLGDVEDYCTEQGDRVDVGASSPRSYIHSGHFVEHDGFIYECQSRIAALKAATTNIISSMAGANVGLMRFNTNQGGSLISAVVDVDGSVSTTDAATGDVVITTNKSKMVAQVLRLPAAGNTPLQESLYEAYLYFAGKTPLSQAEHKNVAPEGSTVDFPTTGVIDTTDDITDPDALYDAANPGDNPLATDVDGDYISPMLNQCQDNNIILFSDGSATSDVGRESLIENLSGLTCSGDTSGDCLDELAYALVNKDVNSDIKLENHVYLHTIGFGSALAGSTQLLNASNEALRPGGAVDSQHYEATNTDQLTTAFQTILLSIENVEADSFIAPAVAVNAFNRLQFRNDLYFALFEPSNTPRWNGNIKKYEINFKGEIIDATGVVAVDDSGFFHENSKSIWSDLVDGNDVSKGGAARELDIDPVRKLFASLSTDGIGPENKFKTLISLLTKENFFSKILDTRISEVNDIGSNGGNLSSVLTSEDLTFLVDNAENNPSEFPLGTSSGDLDLNSQNVVLWTLGEDVDQELESAATDPNFYLGESLHGTPYVLDYGQLSIETVLDINGDPVTTVDEAGNAVEVTEEVITHDDVLFATTNQGVLHAIDGDTGEELWAYIPDPDMFKNLGVYYNGIIDADHTYGLDGEVEFVVERAAGSRAIVSAQVFMGQRRGGSKYFALDLTNANTISAADVVDEYTTPPIAKMWTIDTFERMGQSWARPVAATVNYCGNDADRSDCSERDVLFLSGGYDPAYDDFDASDLNAASWLDDLAGTVQGNAIFMVDRVTGTLLWTAAQTESDVDSRSLGYSTFSEMTHSFPTEPTVVDADFDGVADLMFVTDIAGRIWRFDFRGSVHTNSLKEVFIDENDIHIGSNDYVANTIPFPKDTTTDTTTTYYGSEVAGGIIADLTETDVNRLFYNKLDVSISPRTDNDLARYNIVSGSGYRASPLLDEGFNNRLYFIFDRNIQAPKVIDADEDGYPDQISYDYAATVEYTSSIEPVPADSETPSETPVLTETVTYSRVTASDFSAKNNTIILDTVGAHKHGFFINLATGTKEKMINPTLTNDGIVLAVSYSPTAVVSNNDGDVCEKNIGSSSLYQIDLYTGEAARLDLAKAGISTKPIVIEVDNDADEDNDSGTIKVLIIGSESFDGSKDLETTDGDIDDLVSPGLNDSNVGKVFKANWWERRN